MTRHVALFRGINVGRAKRIAMADLRTVLASLGYSDVATLLNSGNAVFSGPAKPAAWHAQRIRATVAATLGVDALVIVKSAADINAATAANPLIEVATDDSRLLIAFTSDAAGLAALAPLATTDAGADVDRFVVGDHAAYLWCAGGILQSVLATRLLKLLEKTGTTRNAATLAKIRALLDAPG